MITLGVIGVVAAVAMPVLITNINERVQKEQVRSAKYKLTLATDKMKSLGLLNETYPTTQAFINELKKHFKIAKVCDNSHLRDCWPTDEIYVPNNNGSLRTVDINDIKTGEDLEALAPGTKNTTTMGIITADGTPMILAYSPTCTSRTHYDVGRTYSWSMIDNKPETNATTNCISAIMDINGKAKPNRIGKDVRTWNSLFGSVDVGTDYEPLTYDDCMKLKDKLGINECHVPEDEDPANIDKDNWGGAVKKCHEFGLHLPSTQTLALAAGARYGRIDVTPYTILSSVQFAKSNWNTEEYNGLTCEQIWRKVRSGKSDSIICIDNGSNKNLNDNSVQTGASIVLDTSYWSASENSASNALMREFYSYYSIWNINSRFRQRKALCVGD